MVPAMKKRRSFYEKSIFTFYFVLFSRPPWDLDPDNTTPSPPSPCTVPLGGGIRRGLQALRPDRMGSVFRKGRDSQ